jgi:hypothetical protein
VTSFSLAIIAKNHSVVASDESYLGVPAVEEVQESEVPVLESLPVGVEGDLPVSN